MDKITVEIVYGLPKKQTLLSIEVDKDIDVKAAIELSGIISFHTEIDLEVNKVGIWNRTCKLDTKLQHDDRIEIYRPLIADPKEVRKKRAEKAKLEGRADKVTGGRPNSLKKQ